MEEQNNLTIEAAMRTYILDYEYQIKALLCKSKKSRYRRCVYKVAMFVDVRTYHVLYHVPLYHVSLYDT